MMHHAIGRAALTAALTILGAGQGTASGHCAVWLDQGDGTSWTTCVSNDGTQTCWRINNTPGSTAYQVSCG